MEKEQIVYLQFLEQEMNNLNQQFQVIEENISEIQRIKESLKEIERINLENKNSDGTKNEILVDIGKGVYVKVKIIDKNLIVNIGDKKLIKKTIEETKKTLDKNIKDLVSKRSEIINKIKELEIQAEKIIKSKN